MHSTIEIVPANWTVVRLPLPPEEPWFNWLASDDLPAFSPSVACIDVELLPWKCLSGLHPQMGRAGWARVGDTLRGFVCEGASAAEVARDLEATLDLIRVSYGSLAKYRGEAVADAYVKRRYEADKRRCEALKSPLVEEAIGKLRGGGL